MNKTRPQLNLRTTVLAGNKPVQKASFVKIIIIKCVSKKPAFALHLRQKKQLVIIMTHCVWRIL